jgi:hypothetical protein
VAVENIESRKVDGSGMKDLRWAVRALCFAHGSEITILEPDYATQIILPFPSDLHCVDGRQRG